MKLPSQWTQLLFLGIATKRILLNHQTSEDHNAFVSVSQKAAAFVFRNMGNELKSVFRLLQLVSSYRGIAHSAFLQWVKVCDPIVLFQFSGRELLRETVLVCD